MIISLARISISIGKENPIQSMNHRPILAPVKLRFSLRLITLLFFLMYAGTGIYFTFIAVFLSSAGMSGTNIGMINMAGGIVAFFASTFWGYWSDRSGKPRYLLAIASAGTAFTALLFPLSHSFWQFLVLGCVFPFFNIAIITLMDSNLLALLGDNRGDYGRYRLGGSFGYILTTLAAGFLFRERGLEIMFPIFTAIALIFTGCAFFLPDISVKRGKNIHSPRAILAMMRQSSWFVFASCVFLAWLAGSGAISFLGVTLKSMGAEEFLIGIVAASAAIFEIPFMVYNSWFLRKFGSRRMLFYSLLGYVARIGLYSLMPTPAWGIAGNALNGVSYVWLWNASITYANDQAPGEFKATALGLFVSTTALAAVVSAPLSGWMFDNLGPPGMFRVLACVALVAVIIFWLDGRKNKQFQPGIQSPPISVESL
jgi:MFS transporter, PPP family, 3-phenylpropionic acid transporter